MRYVGGYEDGETEWLAIEHLFLADRESSMTIEQLSEKFPSLVATKEEKKTRPEDAIDMNFLKEWIKTASIPKEAKDMIKARLPSGHIPPAQVVSIGVVEDVLWWRKTDASPGKDINATREYKVKWEGCCYRKAQWLPRKVVLHLAQRKLQNFERRMGISGGAKGADVGDEEDKSFDDGNEMPEDSDDEDDEDVFEGIRADWLIVRLSNCIPSVLFFVC